MPKISAIRQDPDDTIPEETANAIFELIFKFANYGFNRSHAAAYGLIAYQTAYLKRHYYAEFTTATINGKIDNLEKIEICVTEAMKKLGMPVLQPDITKSDAYFTVVTLPDDPQSQAILYGLGGLRGIGLAAAKAVIEDRAKKPYADIDDCLARIRRHLPKQKLQTLAYAGAFDCFYPDTPHFQARANILAKAENTEKTDPEITQLDFGAAMTEPQRLAEPVDAQTMIRERTAAFGYVFDDHPVDAFKTLIDNQKVHTIASAKKIVAAMNVTTIGCISDIKETTAASVIAITGLLHDSKTKIRVKFAPGVIPPIPKSEDPVILVELSKEASERGLFVITKWSTAQLGLNPSRLIIRLTEQNAASILLPQLRKLIQKIKLTDADGPHPILIAPPEGTPHETSLKIASLAPQVLDQLRKLNGIADVECLKASA